MTITTRMRRPCAACALAPCCCCPPLLPRIPAARSSPPSGHALHPHPSLMVMRPAPCRLPWAHTPPTPALPCRSMPAGCQRRPRRRWSGRAGPRACATGRTTPSRTIWGWTRRGAGRRAGRRGGSSRLLRLTVGGCTAVPVYGGNLQAGGPGLHLSHCGMPRTLSS